MAENQGHPIVDIPKAVSILVNGLARTGIKYPITSQRNPDGSSTYYWEGKPTVILEESDFIWKNGTAYPKEPPKQLEI